MAKLSSAIAFGQFTDIAIISMSYRRNPLPDQPSKLQSTKYDFSRLLREFKYGEPDTSTRFTLVHDFQVFHSNSKGEKKLLEQTDTSRAAIKKAIQNTLRNASRGGRILIYFGGHMINTSEERAMAVGSQDSIPGSKIRSWMSKFAKEPASVTIALDACNTGGFLDLPFTYELNSGGVDIIGKERTGRARYEFPMIEISAARPGQIAHANTFNDDLGQPEYGGVLTWHLIRALRTSNEQSILELTKHLNKRRDSFEEQQFQVSTSHRFGQP